MSSKRHSILPAVDRSGPKPPVNFSTSLTISDNAVLLGSHSITMQAETVIHPRCRIESSVGSVLVGRRCIVQERVHLGAPPDKTGKAAGGVSLGDYVLVEAGSVVEAGGTEIGEGSVIQVGSRIGSGARIGKVRGSSSAHYSRDYRAGRSRRAEANVALPELHGVTLVHHCQRRGAARQHGCLFQRHMANRQARNPGASKAEYSETNCYAEEDDTEQPRQVPIIQLPTACHINSSWRPRKAHATAPFRSAVR